MVFFVCLSSNPSKLTHTHAHTLLKLSQQLKINRVRLRISLLKEGGAVPPHSSNCLLWGSTEASKQPKAQVSLFMSQIHQFKTKIHVHIC